MSRQLGKQAEIQIQDFMIINSINKGRVLFPLGTKERSSFKNVCHLLFNLSKDFEHENLYIISSAQTKSFNNKSLP
jgi:hypothetical protein